MDDDTGAPNTESGSQLREKLESTLAVNKGLTAELAKRTADGFKFVKPEDLEGVSYDQMAAKAAELEAQRAADRQQVLRDSLAEAGLSGEDLEAALARLKAGGGTPQTEQSKPAPSPFALTGSLGGTPPSGTTTPLSSGRDMIRAGLSGSK